MADVNKSVEITLKANIKQLQKNLEQIPWISAELRQIGRASCRERV